MKSKGILIAWLLSLGVLICAAISGLILKDGEEMGYIIFYYYLLFPAVSLISQLLLNRNRSNGGFVLMNLILMPAGAGVLPGLLFKGSGPVLLFVGLSLVFGIIGLMIGSLIKKK